MARRRQDNEWQRSELTLTMDDDATERGCAEGSLAVQDAWQDTRPYPTTPPG